MALFCIHCRRVLSAHQKAFCSTSCQHSYARSKYIRSWKKGHATGLRGKTTFNISAHVIHYIWEKYNSSCATCSWNEINPYTGKAPLEIDHIDGNAMNCVENNLILLCPNCHSLTKTYKNANKSRGRLWRREKYVKINKLPL